MNQFELKKQATEFEKCQAFIEASIKIIGPTFSVDTNFLDYKVTDTETSKFSKEACQALNQKREKAIAMFAEMGENIYEFTRKNIQLIHKTQKP